VPQLRAARCVPTAEHKGYAAVPSETVFGNPAHASEGLCSAHTFCTLLSVALYVEQRGFFLQFWVMLPWVFLIAHGRVLINNDLEWRAWLHQLMPAGYAEYELRPPGDDVPITAANVGEYLAAVVDATLGSGVAAQVEAFRSGFNEVGAEYQCGAPL